MNILHELKKENQFLVCADSDGCVMDVMDAKHEKCFAPCFIESFGLNHRCTEAYDTWLKINLFSKTRGINRFKACLLTLKDLNVELDGLDIFEDFCNNSPELSNRAIEEFLKVNDNTCMRIALDWSIETNKEIQKLSDFGKPYPNAFEALQKASKVADVVAVSSANKQALYHEWEKHGFGEFVFGLLSQEEGSKTFCINALLEKGYEKKNVIMIGDAPGDIKAAEDNGVWCYPIIVGKEAESWKRFKEEVLDLLIKGKLTNEMQESWINEYYAALDR